MEDLASIMERQGLTKEDLLTMLRQMAEIRAFEETVYDLLGRNVIKGASHLYAGEEAVAVGAIAAIREDDIITSTHRGHGHCHAHGDKHAPTPEAKQEHLNKMMAELCGRATGYCKGRGGSMHIADVANGNLGATGIVGGNIPVATGAGLSISMRKTDQVALCFFGDGASQTGNFHESLNMASLWKLPVVYVVENNLYGMSVPFSKASCVPNVADRAVAYGMPGEIVDGMDVLAVHDAVSRAVARARRGEGPSLIECKTYRWYGHSRSDPRVYRTREEEKAWRERDPIPRLAGRMVEAGVATQEEVDAVLAKAQEAIAKATEFALSSPMPPASEVAHDVYAPDFWTPEMVEAERALRRRVREDKTMRQIPYWQAIVEALREMYGPKELECEDPLEVLILTILSQNTTDVNSHRAFERLRERFGSWDEVRLADVDAIAEAIQVGGLAHQKARRIKAVLEAIRAEYGRLSLDFLEGLDTKDALSYLKSFEGVGPKTAACVLLFGCGKPVFPVDTHILRVSKRLGLVGRDVDADEAHEILGALVPPHLTYELHVNMILHGRRLCKPRWPKCEECLLAGECRYVSETTMVGNSYEGQHGS